MAGLAARAGLLRLAAPSASYCTGLGAEAPGQPAQPRPPYGSRKLPAEEEPPARAFSSSAPAPGLDNKSFLWARYGEMKRLVQGERERRGRRGASQSGSPASEEPEAGPGPGSGGSRGA